MSYLEEYIPLIVRAMFAFSFIAAAVSNVFYKEKKIHTINERGLPFPVLVFWTGLVMQVAGSLAILFNVYLAYGALVLLGFTVLASAIFHDFWNSEGDAYRLKMQGLVSNISLAAGLILLAYTLGKFTF